MRVSDLPLHVLKRIELRWSEQLRRMQQEHERRAEVAHRKAGRSNNATSEEAVVPVPTQP